MQYKYINKQVKALKLSTLTGYGLYTLLATVRIMKPKYLVRPNDFSIFDLDETNECYRSWSKKPITYSDGTRPNAMEHFTLENLTKNYGFFKIDESELEIYEQKCDEHYKFLSWQSRSDGHGGSKGGT